jgi:hypothetical protein
MDFDPDEWARLAREDPAEFERRKQAAVEGVIAQAPPHLKTRLRGLQSRVELELRRARTPLAGALRLQTLMWDQFEALRAALNGVLPEAPDASAPPPDNVVPLAARRGKGD